MLHKSFVSRPEIGPKHFDKPKPEPGPKPGLTRKTWPDLQLCFISLTVAKPLWDLGNKYYWKHLLP